MKKILLLTISVFVILVFLAFCLSHFSGSSTKVVTTESDKDHYDGPMERGLIEVEKTRDPALNRVPTERLLPALLYTENLRSAVNFRTANAVFWNERGPIFDSVGPSNGNKRGVPTGQLPFTFTSGRIRALLVDVSDATGNTVWCGGVAGGLWKCTNFTSTTPNWQPVNDFFDNMAITSIAQDPTNPDVMYFATGEASSNADAVLGKGVWKSTNHGLSWSQLPASASFDRNFKIACDNSGNVYLGTRGYGLRRSTNGGTSWVSISPNDVTPATNETYCTDFEISSTGTLHASFGYTTSSSGGTTLVRYTTDPATVTSSSGWMAPAGLITSANRIELASSGDTVYAAPTNSANSIVSIYRSTDGGANWAKQNAVDYTSPVNISNGQGWYNIALEISPLNPLEILVGGLDAYRSTDGGATMVRNTYWVTNPPYVHADHHNYYWEVVGGQTRIIMATDGGLYVSLDNGLSFEDRNTNLAIKQFYSGAIHPTRTDYLLGGTQDNGSHQIKNPGKTYSIEVTGGDGAYVDIDQVNPQFQFTTYVYNNYRRSTNDGNSWSSFNFTNSRGYFINPYDYDDNQKIIYACYGNRSSPVNEFLRWNDPTTASSAGAASKDIIAVASLNRGGTTNPVAFEVSPYTANRLYVGGHRGSLIRIDNANTVTTATVDANTTILTGSSFPSGGYLNCIAIGSSDNHLTAIFSNYGVTNIWVSTNGGTSWTASDGNLPDMPVRWAVYNPNDDTKMFIATEAGVYSTDLLNGSATVWTPSPGFPLVRTDMLKVRKSDNTILAATHGRGLWTANIPIVAPLPIRHLQLNGSIAENGIARLEWTADGAGNRTKFQLQHSRDGIQFSTVAELNSSSRSFEHKLNGALGFYRVIAVEPNIAAKVSNVVLLKINNRGGLQVAVVPNPVQSNSNILITGLETGLYQWSISDASGKIHKAGSATASPGGISLPMETASLQKGLYHIMVRQGRKQLTKSFLKL